MMRTMRKGLRRVRKHISEESMRTSLKALRRLGMLCLVALNLLLGVSLAARNLVSWSPYAFS